MPTIRMRALKALPYGGRTVSEGEEFDVARPIEALALSYGQKAKLLTGTRLHLDTADLVVEPASEPEPSDEQPRRRRRYRRRDLTAEPQ